MIFDLDDKLIRLDVQTRSITATLLPLIQVECPVSRIKILKEYLSNRITDCFKISICKPLLHLSYAMRMHQSLALAAGIKRLGSDY